MDFIDVGSLAILHKGIHLPDSQHRSRFEMKSPRMALTGDLPGGQETHSTGVRLACRGGQRAPWETCRGVSVRNGHPGVGGAEKSCYAPLSWGQRWVCQRQWTLVPSPLSLRTNWEE